MMMVEVIFFLRKSYWHGPYAIDGLGEIEAFE